MRYFFQTLIPQPETRWSVIRQHILPAVLIVMGLLGLYWLSVTVDAGPFTTYLLSSATMALIGLTALAWLNDLSHEEFGPKSQFRRAGLILVGAACLSLIFSPLVTYDWPNWRECLFRLGSLIVWMTMDGMPPWHLLISGDYKHGTSDLTAREAGL
jgi:hypothetical protein